MRSQFCLPGEEARPQSDAISPGLRDQEVARSRRCGQCQAIGAQRHLEASQVCKQTGLITVGGRAASSGCERAAVFIERSRECPRFLPSPAFF